ncbi:hypothetical protein FHR99_001879 [Litorivivens lipolytica]|uniref:Uncharacterized protein n=1 Tax=Litorivivens lipolytica TaxID=1524264 RepID=A0A7W4Z5W5_9GAMM|nr:hypothetical protein [Litorivivens lipolytica]
MGALHETWMAQLFSYNNPVKTLRSFQIKTIQLHHFDPGVDKVLHKAIF